MKRQILNYGQIPLDTQQLQQDRNVLTMFGSLMQAVVGDTMADGFKVTPTTTASMVVNVAPGSVIVSSTIDTAAIGRLAADTRTTLKLGQSLDTVQLTLAAPTTAGTSQNYVVYAGFQTTDTTPTSTAFVSKNSNGVVSTYTQTVNAWRDEQAYLGLAAGGAATTGSQTTPSVPSGTIPLYVITVAYGTSAITASMISNHPDSKFVPYKLADLKTAIRTKLTGNLYMYVSPAGNDANTGLSSDRALKTLQAAADKVKALYDLNNYAVVVYVAAGTYAGVLLSNNPVGGSTNASINFVGLETDISKVVISAPNGNCVQTAANAMISLQNMTLTATGTNGTYQTAGNALVAGQGSKITIVNVAFGKCDGIHMLCQNNAIITCDAGSYSITGGATTHYYVAQSGLINTVKSNITLTGTPSFTGGFAVVDTAGVLQCYTAVFTGTATGTRYLGNRGGTINVAGASSTFLPGDTAGALYTYATYG